jgi:hypothetical protein
MVRLKQIAVSLNKIANDSDSYFNPQGLETEEAS